MTSGDDEIRKYVEIPDLPDRQIQELLASKDPERRASGLMSWSIHGDDLDAVEKVGLSWMDSRNPVICEAAISAMEELLRRHHPLSLQAVVPKTLDLVNSENPGIRGAALFFLETLLANRGGRRKFPLEVLMDEREMVNVWKRFVALGDASRNPPEPEFVVQHLERFLNDAHFAIRAAALNAIANFLGQEIKLDRDLIVSVVSRANQDAHWWVREKAALITETIEIYKSW